MREDNSVVLWGPAEPAAAAPGYMRDDSVREHADAQRGGGGDGDDDVSGHWDLPPASGRAVRRRQGVLQGVGARRYLLGGDRGYEHPHRVKCQPHIGWHVEELLPGGESDQFQYNCCEL